MFDLKRTEKLLNGEDNSNESKSSASNLQRVTYQYLCSMCNHITEKRFPFGNPEHSIPCETEGCNGIAMKVISTPGILTGIPTHPARQGRGKGRK